MRVVVLATEAQKDEWGRKHPDGLVWISDENELMASAAADAFIDLTFVNTAERNALLRQLLPKPVIINSVADTLKETNSAFIRINGWSTFLSTPVVEAVCDNDTAKGNVESVFSYFDKKVEWMPDEPGFVAARVVSMIINEAYLALAEEVSTKEEVDTAMKFGTAYPFGPFEWAQKIGVKNIVALLQKMSQKEPRYAPAALLVKEAAAT